VDNPMQVLFIDDEEMIRISSRQTLQLAGIPVAICASADEALPFIVRDFAGIVVTDVRMPNIDGLALLSRCTEIDPELPVVIITGHGDVTMAVKAMREGAYDFIEKPFGTEHLVDVVRRALEKRRLVLENRNLRRALEHGGAVEGLILGRSPPIVAVRRLISEIADTDADVLVVGETGTGKELVARALHEAGPRRGKPFVALNCGALPEAVFESEVFGHETGAFTGAVKRRIGKIEHASDGTLFLDELESMPLALQVKLLRVLEQRVLERLGSNETVAVRCRMIAATKDNLLELSRQGRFRADLYYRLNVVTIDLPALSERREDIPLLFEHFSLQAALRYNRPAIPVPAAKLRRLMAQDWPGNVRELKNTADRFVLGIPAASSAASGAGESLPELLDRLEKQFVQEAMRAAGGNVLRAAEALGIPRKTLYDKLKRHGLTPASEQ